MIDPGFVVIGAGGHARSVIHAIRTQNALAKIFIAADPVPSAPFEGCPVIGKPEAIFMCVRDAFIAIGDNAVRERIKRELDGIGFLRVIHSTASCATSSAAQIHEGVFVGAHAYIGPQAIVSKFCIVNSGCVVEHDVFLDEFAHLAPGVIVGGGTTIGARTFIGMGSVIRDHIKIGNHCMIGMGSIVIEDVPDYAVLWGNPARIASRSLVA